MMYIKTKKSVKKIKDVKSYMALCQMERMTKNIIWNMNLNTVKMQSLMGGNN